MASQDTKKLETRKAHGGKQSFHGCSYQLKLLMLFIVRGLRNNLRFRVETEIEEAGKFDDVVFEQLNGDDKQFRFLQAKHSAGEARGVITARNLLIGVKGDFCLPIYFKSYQTILAYPRFCGENKEIKDLILFTNKSFNYQDRFCDFQLSEDIFEKEKLENGEDKVDEILKTPLLRFKKDFEGKPFLVSHLKNAFVEIPNSFAKCVTKGEAFNMEQNIPAEKASELYCDVLLKEVIDLNAQSFRPPFIEDVDLSPEARHFRDVLKSESFSMHRGNEHAFRTEMKTLKVKVIGNAKRGRIKIEKPAKLAEKLASCIRKSWNRKIIVVTDGRSIVAKNIEVLTDYVLETSVEGELRFSPEFISGDNLKEGILEFRRLLAHEVNKRNLEFASIDQFKFEIENFEKRPTLPSLSNDEILEAFLEKLVFAVDQPNETEMDDLIMEELLKEFRAVEAENVHGRFLKKTFNWMTDIKGRELSHEECRIFFENLKREMSTSVRFRVKHPSTNFTGREKELNDLQEALKDKGDQWLISQSVVIIGMAGVGKSELAKRYTYLHSDEYDNIIWINAKSNDTIGNSFRKLAFDKLEICKESVNGNLKDLEIVVSDVYDFLRGKSSLFIFDGAEKLGSKRSDSGIRKFLPKFPLESKHYTLITSRYQNWGDMKRIKLDTFSENEAVALIGKTINHRSSTQISQARDLAKALQYYPLALQQALSYIKAKIEELGILGQIYTISDYLQALEVMSRELLDFPLEIYSSDSLKRTYKTWKITMLDIASKRRGKLAVKILGHISYFAPDDISFENVSILFRSEEKSNLIQTLMFLKRYSLILIEQDKVSIHRLVQMTTRLTLQDEGKEEVILKRLLYAGGKLDVEHSMSIWKYSLEYNDLIEEFSHLPCSIIQKLTDNFKLGEAYEFAERTLIFLENKLGKKHESVLDLKEKMASVVSYLGHKDEALKIYKELYKDRLLTQEDGHPSVLKIKHYIANTLSSIGRHKEALKCYKEVLKIVLQQYGEDHIDTLCIENNIANILYCLGDYQKAFCSYEKVYNTMRVSLGQDHEKVQNVKLNMANVLGKLGQHEKALSYYQEVYEMSKDSLNGNLMILDARFNMASVLGNLGKYSEALNAYEEVLEKLTDIFGSDHPDTLDTKYNICRVLYKLNEYERALKLYLEVGEAFSNMYGEMNEKTLHCNFCAAHVLYNREFYEEALHHYQDVYKKVVESKGHDHPKVLPTKQCIANTLYKLGEFDKALQIYKENLKEIILQFGENDEKTLSSKQHLAKILVDRGRYMEAYEMCSEIYQQKLKQYGERNEETLTAKYNLACTLHKLDKLNETIVYLRDVHKKQINVLGEENPSTKKTEEDLQNVLFEIQTRKSKTYSYLEFIDSSAKIEESVEEESDDVHDYHCPSWIRCLCPIKTLLI